ncbi:hypothetical protein DFH09DRAFT_1505277 [Mycena vulgaris]|nr:hypothetical protein DFH09DRAFT_1505277 [Mycena vulgaris]
MTDGEAQAADASRAAAYASVCGRSWQCPAPSGSAHYCCCRATSPSSTRLIPKGRLRPTTPGPPGTVARARPRPAFPLLSAPRRHSAYPRERRRGRLSAAGVRAYATARRGRRPLRLQCASPLACSLPEVARCKTDPRHTARPQARPPPPTRLPRPRPRPRVMSGGGGDRGVGCGGVGVSDVDEEEEAADEGERSKEGGSGVGLGASSRAVGVGGGMDARAAVAMVHGDELRGTSASSSNAHSSVRAVVGTLVHPPILKRSALWMAVERFSHPRPGAGVPVPALDLAPAPPPRAPSPAQRVRKRGVVLSVLRVFRGRAWTRALRCEGVPVCVVRAKRRRRDGRRSDKRDREGRRRWWSSRGARADGRLTERGRLRASSGPRAEKAWVSCAAGALKGPVSQASLQDTEGGEGMIESEAAKCKGYNDNERVRPYEEDSGSNEGLSPENGRRGNVEVVVKERKGNESKRILEKRSPHR